MTMTHQDKADYMEMKYSFGMGYELEDIKNVFINGGFEHYSYTFLNYMLLVLSNTAKIGKQATYSGEHAHRFDKLGFIREVGAKNFRGRTVEFIEALTPKLAMEMARLTLVDYTAPNECFNKLSQVKILGEQFDNTNEILEKFGDTFLEIYFSELDGKVEDTHKKRIKEIIQGVELTSYVWYLPSFKSQMERYTK